MKIILKFKNGTVKEKDIPVDEPPEKIAFSSLDSELHSFVSKMPKDKQGAFLATQKNIILTLDKTYTIPTYIE